MFLILRRAMSLYWMSMSCSSDFSWSNLTVVSNGSPVTTLPSESQTSGCGQPSDGRQSGSVATFASLPEVWKSSHTCCVSSPGSCPWVMLRFLYLPAPAKIFFNCLGPQCLFVFETIWNHLGCFESSPIIITKASLYTVNDLSCLLHLQHEKCPLILCILLLFMQKRRFSTTGKRSAV